MPNKHQQNKKSYLSILIPAYHEEKNILKTLKEIDKKVKTFHETLVIVDTKKDPTYEIVKSYLKKYKNRKIRLILNDLGNKKGAMNAIKTGFKNFRGEVVVVLMADLSDDISQIDRMYKLFDKGWDIVCASRYMKGGRKIGGPILKTLLSRIASLSLYYFFGVPTHDATNAFKLYSRKVIENIKVESVGGFEYSMEIILKAHKSGYKITEIPTVWKDRVSGSSNFKIISWIPDYAKRYFEVFNFFSERKRKIIFNLLYISLLSTLTILSYYRSLGFYFYIDDYYHIWVSLYHPLSNFLFIHPGTTVEVLALIKFFGNNPMAWEAVGIILRIICAYLVAIFLYKLLKNKLAGFLAGIFFACSYVGAFVQTAFNYHVPNLAAIFLLLGLIIFIDGINLQSKKKAILFYLFILISIFLDPARVLPILFILPFLFFLYKDSKKKKYIRKYLTKIYIPLFIMGLPLSVVWYHESFHGGESHVEIFIRGMMNNPHIMIKKTKLIGNLFATVANLFADNFRGLPLEPVQHETAYYERPYGVIGVLIFLISLTSGLIYFFKKKKYFLFIFIFIFWIFVFYFPNWLHEPRVPYPPMGRYLFIAGIGYICLLGYLLSQVKNKLFVFLVTVVFVVFNIYKTNSFLILESDSRSSILLNRVWNTIITDVPSGKGPYIFMFGGDTYPWFRNIMLMGAYNFTTLRHDSDLNDIPKIIYWDEDFILRRLCTNKISINNVFIWDVEKPGILIDVSSPERKSLMNRVNQKNCPIYLKEKELTP